MDATDANMTIAHQTREVRVDRPRPVTPLAETVTLAEATPVPAMLEMPMAAQSSLNQTEATSITRARTSPVTVVLASREMLAVAMAASKLVVRPTDMLLSIILWTILPA